MPFFELFVVGLARFMDFEKRHHRGDSVQENSVAIIRLFKQTTVITHEKYVQLDRSAIDSPSLDLIERYLLEGLNGFISYFFDDEKASVFPQFFINQSPTKLNDEVELFTSIVTKGRFFEEEMISSLRSSVRILIELIIGNVDVFSDDEGCVLSDSETEFLNRYARQFLRQNGCKRITDNLCVHAGFDDSVGIQISDRLAPSDTITTDDQEVSGTAFLDGYILSKNIVYLVNAKGNKGASKAFICDHPEILQKIRQNPFLNRVAYTGYQRGAGGRKSSLHVTWIEVVQDEEPSGEFKLSLS
jgi:hypothetical protein